MENEVYLSETCRRIRISLLEMIHRSKSSHIGTGLSTIEALVSLYFHVMKIDPKNPTDPKRDKFILSKAHGSAALYATLAERGFFPHGILNGYYIDGGTLPGHLDREAVPGVETSGGSLGHGLSLGVGMALANQIDGNPGHVYVLLGDGECNEGSVWEAVMIAPTLKLKNLTALVDFNHIQSLGRTNEVIDQSNLIDRWKAFGWETQAVNGHQLPELISALTQPHDRPKAIIMDTVKGKGISFMENKLLWHYRSPSDEELKQALEELGFEGRPQ